MLHCSHQQYRIKYCDQTTTSTKTKVSACVPAAPLRHAPVSLRSGDVGSLRYAGSRFSRVVELTERDPDVRFVRSRRLLEGPLSSWWWGGGVLRGVRLAERAGAAEAATQRPPVLLALSAQAPADPQPDLVSTLKQEVHQLHVRSVGTRTNTTKNYLRRFKSSQIIIIRFLLLFSVSTRKWSNLKKKTHFFHTNDFCSTSIHPRSESSSHH